MMLTLSYSYWEPNFSLRRVSLIEVPSDKRVYQLRDMIAQRRANINSDSLDLYKIPEDTPVFLAQVKTTKISLSDLGDSLSIECVLEGLFQSQPSLSHLHLVVVNFDVPLAIHCWIRSRNSDVPIELTAPWKTTVASLLAAAQGKSKPLDIIPIERLQVYKISYNNQEELAEIVQRTGFGHALLKSRMLETVFDDVPFNEHPCIVVEVVDLKDKRLPSWDVVERASKKAKVSPSNYDYKEYLAAQRDNDKRFLDSRTVKTTGIGDKVWDTALPPVQVLYMGFGEFLDTYWSERQSQFVGGSAALRHEVEMFAEEMSQIFDSENERQSDGLARLNRIFFEKHRPLLVPSNIGRAFTDGHYVYGEYKIPCLFVEFKNEDAGSSAIPTIQLAAYYELSVGAVCQARGELTYCSRLPALGLTIVGPVVTFYSMLWVGSVVVFPLTSGISCLPLAAGGDDRRALHCAFIAATNLLSQIERDADKLSKTHTPAPRLLSHFHPDITELPSFPNSQVSINFQITDVVHTGPGRIVYRAESRSLNLDLAIKVTPSYSIDLHAFCAARGQAPAIRAFKRFPGNIVVVAMDYLKSNCLGTEGSQEFRNKLAEQLTQLVKDFHLAGYVHGDLRLPNIYRVGDIAMLLDFDWGGRVGEARYPYQTLNSVLREGRDMDNLMITKEDDERVLKESLASIGCP